MRLLKLTMQGFMSYGNLTEIDFSLLGTEGTYLITGDTGSGKSSIFDAIKYALYGYSSGTERKNISCVNAAIRDKIRDGAPDAPNKAGRPFVSLTFEAGGIEYTIKRKPQIDQIHGLKGGWSPEVELISEDRSVSLGSINEVKEKIEELTGLDEARFSSVAMIAQGEFTKLVCAKSDEREKILNHIFDIDKFNRFEYILKDRMSAAKKEKEEAETTLKTNCENISEDEGNLFYEELKDAKIKASNSIFDKLTEACANFISDDKKHLVQIQKDLETSESEKKKTEDILSSIKRCMDLKKDIENLKNSISASEKELTSLSEVRKELESRKEVTEALTTERITIENQLDKYKKLSDTSGELKKIVAAKTDALKKKETAEQEIILYSAQTDNAEKKLAEYSDLSLDIKEAADRCVALTSFEDKFTDYLNKKESVRKNLITKNKLEKDKDQKELDFTTKSAKYFSNISAVIAAKLQMNMPCPVCGSVTHPSPALSSEELVTEDDVKNAENTFNSSRKKYENAVKTVSSQEAALEEIKKALSSDSDKIFSGCVLFENLDVTTISDEKSKAEANLSELQKLEKEKTDLEKSVKNLKDKVLKATETLNEAAKDLIHLETREAENNKLLSELKNELKFDTEGEAKKEIRRIQLIEKDYADRLKKNTEDTEFHKNEKSKNEGILISKKEELSEMKIPESNESEIRAIYEEIIERCKKLKSEEKKYNSRIDHNCSQLEKVEKNIQEYTQKLSRFEIYKTLYGVANGTTAGKRRISFTKYILSIYFKEIIFKANQRFNKITDSRYSLEILESAGLQLNVRDEYNNTVRDAATLSGGEKFKAALSLAFAFQEEMGGSGKLECLFIDEGFGSLSENDLNQVMGLLVNQAGAHKQIGVISHVAEMKEKISKYIYVTKDLSGNSKVNISI